ncbi:sugar MFS transporter [Xanthovirga aplysinae]|uniref:sugar MFS transporter n=1 Tax=Xanthovirga aplysinae TaxID=2529853 RepID=UPI0012BC1B75|nr:sugar MFS transporter [Xanthovirga aplysinae]MTI29646.1 sugar MFS transporter [Xanthovirga aplysinae]
MAAVTITKSTKRVPQGNLEGGGEQNYSMAISSLMVLFFLFGFITSLNDILIPYMKVIFQLNYTEAMLINSCFFGAYFVMSIPASKIIEKVGYKRGLVLGLLTAAFGAVLFYPAADSRAYGLFLGALFILATGVVLLQVAGNPYVSILGKPETASGRLTLTQAFNSLGTTLGPLLGTHFILKSLPEIDTLNPEALSPSAVQIPYVLIGVVLVIIGLVIAALKLPVISRKKEENEAMASPQHLSGKTSAFQYSHLVLGAVGIFAYVGAEVSIGSLLVNYIGLDSVKGLAEHEAGYFVPFYWGGAMVGRFLGAYILNKFKPAKVLVFNAALAALLVLITIVAEGNVALVAILAIGFFNSIMFPTIFTLGIAGVGKFTEQASGIMSTAIVGGALLPLLQGVATDMVGLRIAFIIPVFCYLYIVWYGWKGHIEKH